MRLGLNGDHRLIADSARVAADGSGADDGYASSARESGFEVVGGE